MPIVLCVNKRPKKTPLSDQHTGNSSPVQNLMYEKNAEL